MLRSDNGPGRFGVRSSSASSKLHNAVDRVLPLRNAALRWLARGRLAEVDEVDDENIERDDEDIEPDVKLSSVLSSSQSLSDPARDGVLRLTAGLVAEIDSSTADSLGEKTVTAGVDPDAIPRPPSSRSP